MSKPGRNEPCYCGSGLKYKKCHLPIDQAAEKEQRAVALAARFLRRDMPQFARDERFAESFAAALPFYWNGLYDIENAEEMSMPEALRFFDWFMFDYQPQDGPRLFDLYYEERWPDLASPQQALLAQWRDAPPSGVYELVDYEGQLLHLKEYMTGETLTVFEAGGPGEVEIGELLLARPVRVQDRLEFSTDAAYLPEDEIADLADKLAAAKTADSQRYPEATYDEFMRRHNVLLVHHALEQAEIQGRPPVARLDPDRPDKKTQKLVRGMKRLRR